MTRPAYRQAEAFGLTLRRARDLARAGKCKPAKRAFKEASRMGYDLVDRLPDAHGEIVRKLRMVEKTLLSNECSAPRVPPGVTKRLHRLG